METKLVIAGKTRLATSILHYVLKQGVVEAAATAVLPVQNDSGEDGWQPSLRKTATNLGVPICQLQDLTECKGVFLSLEFDRIMEPSRYKFSGMFNLHFSLLPAYKGCWTSILPILHGQKQSGTTLHVLDGGIDTGAIIDQSAFDLRADETAWTLYDRYIDFGIDLVRNSIAGLLAADFESRKQPLANSSYFSRDFISRSSSTFSERLTLEQMDRHVRAYYFPVFQTADFRGKPVYSIEPLKDTANGRPCILDVQADHTDVQAIDAQVRLHHKPAQERQVRDNVAR